MAASILTSPALPDTPASPAEVLSWLQLLNSSELDRIPTVDFSEDQRLCEYRRREPSFSLAAASWPSYAVAYWDTLHDEIWRLFDTSSGRHNFAQWLLEYARETHPKKYKPPIGISTALASLAQQLAEGLVTPLHMAAALGLADLVKGMQLTRIEVNVHGILGPPVFCALVGPNVLETGFNPANWKDVFKSDFTSQRGEVVEDLLLYTPWCKYRYEIQDIPEWEYSTQQDDDEVGRASFLGLAFWAAASCNKPMIVDDMVRCGAEFDAHTVLVVTGARECMPRVAEQRESFRNALKALASVINQEYVDDPSPFEFFEDPFLQQLFVEVMEEYGVKLAFEPPDELMDEDEEDFNDILGACIREGQVFEVERLRADPRFDLCMMNSLDMKDESSETLLHTAVSGNQERIVDFLIEAGADLKALDDQGRTPVMVVETAEMLDFLYRKHKADISELDLDGRSLWHYACCSHDMAILEWLCANDPEKEESLQTFSFSRDESPLDVALASIRQAPRFSCVRDARLPRRLVQEMKECGVEAHTDVDVHGAVTWGSADLVEGMVAIGADFTWIDEGGNSVLHNLNAMATPELVSKLMAIVGPESPNFNHDSQTPAEAMILNILDIHAQSIGSSESSVFQPSQATLSRETYCELLRGEDFEFRNHAGQCLWERVCAAINKGYTAAIRRPHKSESIIESSLSAAILGLIDSGVIQRYEDRKKTPAIAPLVDLDFGPQKLMTTPWFFALVRRCNETLLKEFCKDDENGPKFLLNILTARKWETIAYLAQIGLPLDAPNLWDEEQSCVELVLVDEHMGGVDRLTAALKSSLREPFIACTAAIYSCLINRQRPETPEDLEMLRLLLEAGLSPNPSLQSDQPIFPLIDAVRPKLKTGTIRLLLNHGADPALGPDGTNAFLIVALNPTRNIDKALTVMRSIIDALEGREPPFAWDREYEEPPMTFPITALQAIAWTGRARMLQLVLQQTPLKNIINGLSPPRVNGTPAHMAAMGGHVECLEVLAAEGADLTRRDSEGRTPGELAAMHWRAAACRAIDRLLQQYS